MMQTQEAILAEIERVAQTGDDFFGAQRQELIHALTFENAKPFLTDGATSEMWDAAKPYRTDEDVREAARDYLEFAVSKALGHRGLSAGRSVQHYLGWVFLVAGEEARVSVEEATYQNYGVPQLLRAATALEIGSTWAIYNDPNTEDGRKWKNMGLGRPCVEDCDEGCGR